MREGHEIGEEKVNKLKMWFAGVDGVITAFSGGVDSALTLFVARKVLGKNKAVGVISKSESLKSKDYKIAQNFAEEYDIKLLTIHTYELADENYSQNTDLRCYFCKTHLYHELSIVQKTYPNFVIINGTNADDFSDFRPGHKAADEQQIKSPLAECGFTKADIRTLSNQYKLSVWDKPASPCLSSRIPYGNIVTKEKLIQIETAEEILNSFGFFDTRVRHYGNYCSIEVPHKQIEILENSFEEISKLIKDTAGFKNCIVDKEGLVSGKLNRSLVY